MAEVVRTRESLVSEVRVSKQARFHRARSSPKPNKSHHPITVTVQVYPEYNLAVHKWSNGDESSGAAVCVYHGYGAHGQYPTVRYAAEVRPYRCCCCNVRRLLEMRVQLFICAPT